MTYALICAENGDIIGTCASRADAIRWLAVSVQLHPEIQDEIGLRPYESGRPAGAYESAIEVLGDRMTDQHLI